MKQPEKTPLDPNRFIARIRTSPEYLRRLPKADFRELPKEAREHSLHRAIAASALSLARHEKSSHGEYSLDANLFELVSGLQSFYEESRELSYLRERYHTPKHMPPREKDRFYDNKQKIRNFNSTLGEVIDTGASQFDFGELLTFMTNMFSASNDRKYVDDFHERAREAIIGIRNEIGVEQLLIAGGVEYRKGTPEEDGKGGDYFINEVPIDFKASEESARNARQKAEEGGYDGGTILWSHINFEDFEGKLVLPVEKCPALFAKLEPELDQAVTSHSSRQMAHAI